MFGSMQSLYSCAALIRTAFAVSHSIAMSPEMLKLCLASVEVLPVSKAQQCIQELTGPPMPEPHVGNGTWSVGPRSRASALSKYPRLRSSRNTVLNSRQSTPSRQSFSQ